MNALGLIDVEVYAGRAEDLALNPLLRESFDVVVSRGVAPMRILMELTLPYCRVGGMVVTLKKERSARRWLLPSMLWRYWGVKFGRPRAWMWKA